MDKDVGQPEAPGEVGAQGAIPDDALLGLDEVGATSSRHGRRYPSSYGPKQRNRSATPGIPIAETLPVARVVLDLRPMHLDRPYDYLVPASMAHDAQPGVRIKARFGRQDVSGYIIARLETSDHHGRLVPLRRVVSGEQVLTPHVLQLCRAVADRFAGTLADVLRLAIPPRHARVEKEAEKGNTTPPQITPVTPLPEHTAWTPYRGGEAYLRRIQTGESPRAVWSALPGRGADTGSSGLIDASLPHWAIALAQAVQSCAASGRGALVVVPDARDVTRVATALDAAHPTTNNTNTMVRLLAEDGPAPRYRAFLQILRGTAHVVVGTRAAAFAPIANLGLVVLWGDGEETLAEPHAPYPHSRDVLALRAEQENAAFLLGSPGRTVQAQALLAAEWARELTAPRDVLRVRAPRVRALTSVELAREGAGAAARLPSAAWQAARDALERGPVLIQVPRTGYLPVVACSRCRTAARCDHCHGPLGLPQANGAPQCAWCGQLAGGWHCQECGWTGLRSVRVGSARTAEELGRAFTGIPVRQSAATAPGGVLDTIPAAPALIVATPGAEPVAETGYTAALLLDAAVMTAGTGLAAGTEALHRWLAASSLVRPAPEGQILLIGDGAPGPTQALVRWDPSGFAQRELDERAELNLPPAVRVAAVTGDRMAVDAVVQRIGLRNDGGTRSGVLGPVEVDPDESGRGPQHRNTTPAGGAVRSNTNGVQTLDLPVRTILRVPRTQSDELARRLKASLVIRSARREGGYVRVQIDPKEML